MEELGNLVEVSLCNLVLHVLCYESVLDVEHAVVLSTVAGQSVL